MKHFITISFILLITQFAFSQITPIDTDRPDQTESVFLVPKNWIQFESGFNYQKTDKSEKEFLTPTLLTRYGLCKGLELRLGTSIRTESTIYVPAGTVNESGLDVIELGAKITLFEEKKIIPKTSFLFHVGIPATSSPKFRPTKVPVNFRFTMQHSLTSNIGLGYNAGCEWDGFTNDPAYVYTLSLGCSPTGNTYVYAEGFGGFKKNMVAEHNLDAGFAYLISDNVKIDVSSGFGISSSAPKWYVALGFSARFKTH